LLESFRLIFFAHAQRGLFRFP